MSALCSSSCLRVWLLAAAFSAPVFAQAPDSGRAETSSALAGVVQDTTGRPIQHVTVFVDGKDLATVTDDAGRFHLAGVAPGTTLFTAMRLGFKPVSFEADLPPDTTVVIAIRLRPVPTLSAVQVSATRIAEGLKRVGFYERKRTGLGSYITPERIDSIIFSAKPSALLRDVRGIELKCRGVACDIVSRWGPGCLMLFVDGHYSTDTLDRRLAPDAIAAIEVYERPNLVPIEFQAPLPPKRGVFTRKAGCGAIVVWTKSRAQLPIR